MSIPGARLRATPRGEGKIDLHLDASVAEIILRNPRRRNAISPGMMIDLEDIVARLETWKGAAVILRGEGPHAFCSGGDLRAVEQHLMSPGMGDEMCGFMQGVLDRLTSLPLVTIAAHEGSALGGGAELLMRCQEIFSGRSATVGFVHARLGVSPGWGGAGRLVARVGAHQARRVLSSARIWSATDAFHIGLIDAIVDDGQALDRARQLAAEVAKIPRAALETAIHLSAGQSAEVERQAFAKLWGSAGHRAALAARRRR